MLNFLYLNKYLIWRTSFLFLLFSTVKSTVAPPDDLVIELTDKNWDQIQKGQWMVGFFDKDTKGSQQLENDWPVLALKCKEQNIKVGKIFGPHNPGLDVRFLVTVFPKAFYVKNGVAHEIPKVNRAVLIDVIKDKQWSQLKPVSFLYNPFSVQMSLLSHLFIHAVNLYNYEDAIVQKVVPFASATDIVFGLTFIVIGTALGLLLTCAIDVIQMFFFTYKESGDTEDEKVESDHEKEDDKAEESSEDSASVRKRK